ncbi:phosphate transport system protein [Neobacillus niacini]|jgi:phosphate transport system protein|uniref:phosphate signaling complex protein PhoU n=1 Tax=Neobacillus driksii TaxID=3035913 RepID=UPI00278184BB|nr:phosphate signaling complex protein PhoU [Neobacillus niacini]MDQ0975842.1 phosphate transport system protein [Neobacillus niacini]
MSTRSKFDSKLVSLKEKLLKMEKLAETAVRNSLSALINHDLEKANQVIEEDNAINALEHEIHDMALLLIARESPVAKDLRTLNVALKVSSEVERMADMAVNIAKATLHIGNEKHFKEILDIPKMMDHALEMVTMSVKAYVDEDVMLAQKCAERDDVVDNMFGNLVHELISKVPENPSATNQIIQLAFVCRFIERIADHSTNIAENVIYLVTGKHFDLNE